MIPRLVVRPRVRQDIIDIAEFIAADNLDASDRFIDKVYESFELLARMRQLGSARRFRRESLRGLRLWRLPGGLEQYIVVYREVVYREQPERVEIIRVLHGAREIERLLRD